MIEFFKDSVQIERRTFTTDANGESGYTWATIAEVRASFQIKGGNPVFIGNQARIVRTATMFMAPAEIMEGDRVTYRSMPYIVQVVYQASDRHYEVQIIEEVIDAG